MPAAAEPIDPKTLPKEFCQTLDKINEDDCGSEPGVEAESGWACRFTGWMTCRTSERTPENKRTFYICGPNPFDTCKCLIVGGDFDPADVQAWENGTCSDP